MPRRKSNESRSAPAHMASINPQNSKFCSGRLAMNQPSPNSSTATSPAPTPSGESNPKSAASFGLLFLEQRHEQILQRQARERDLFRAVRLQPLLRAALLVQQRLPAVFAPLQNDQARVRVWKFVPLPVKNSASR